MKKIIQDILLTLKKTQKHCFTGMWSLTCFTFSVVLFWPFSLKFVTLFKHLAQSSEIFEKLSCSEVGVKAVLES